MNQKIEKYLPIGTVVILKGATKRLMITGFCVTAEQNNLMYDYSGCLYPEGIVSIKNAALFNHEQIDRIYFVGYSNNEEKNFKINLNSSLQKLNKDSNELQKVEQTSKPQEFDSQTVPPVFNTLDLNQQNNT